MPLTVVELADGVGETPTAGCLCGLGVGIKVPIVVDWTLLAVVVWLKPGSRLRLFRDGGELSTFVVSGSIF